MRIVKYLLLLIFTISCAPAPETTSKSSVAVKFPKSENRSGLRSLMPAKVRNEKLASLDDIDCYAVLLSWGEDFAGEVFEPGRCFNGNEEFVIGNIKQVEGGVPDGGLIEMFVPSDRNVRFTIVGFSYGAGVCPSMMAMSRLEKSIIGNFTIVGETKEFIEGEFMEVNVNISLDNSTSFSDCKDGPFFWEGEDSGAADGDAGIFGSSFFGSATFGP